MRNYVETFQFYGSFYVVHKTFMQMLECRKKVFALAAVNASNTKTRLSEPQVLYQRMISKNNSLS